jgi:predicted enzyme related to lactoylglutathione lyase
MSDAGNGRFIWHELLTTDTASAGKFFSKAIGWKAKPWAADRSYSLFETGKRAAGGLMTLPDDPKKMGAAPHWLSYVGVANVDDAVRQALTLGGRVINNATDIPNAGRYAILADPQGATFGVYTAPSPHDPAQLDADFSWHELATTDPVGALTFYKKMFGWEDTGSMDMGADLGTYYMFGWSGKPGGGIFKKNQNMPGPSAWLAYIKVPDSRKTAAGLAKLGGTVINGPMEVPGGDWIAQAIDAQGAMFAVHSLKPAAAPAKPAATAKAAAPVKPARKTAAKRKPVRKAAKPAKKAAKPAKKAMKPAKKTAAKKAAPKKKASGKKKAGGKNKAGKRR